jgi:tRNA U34 2-thiouridine synthase MnmA/TrmU
MTIKYDLADDTYVWYELDDGEYEYVEEVAEVEKLCQRLGVSMSINDANKDYYNIIVYLNYEG